MIVKDFFNLKDGKQVLIFDPGVDLTGAKLNQTVRRTSDNEEWTIHGIEKWSSGRPPYAICLKGEALVDIGDDLILVT